MRIFLVGASQGMGRCGVSDYIRCLASALTAAGVSTEVIRETKDYWPADWRMLRVVAVYRLLRDAPVDLVHVHYPSRDFGARLLPWMLPLLARWVGKPSLVTLHEPVSLLRIYRLLPVILAGSALVTVRPNLLQLMGPVQRWLLRGNSLTYLRSASTLPVSRMTPEARKALRRGLDCSGRLLVFFGFLYRSKGVHSLARLSFEAGDVLAIAGEAPDDEYFRELMATFREAGVDGQVRFLGKLGANEASDLIAAADALLLPFEAGGGDWNTSIHAGIQNSTFVVTTSTTRSGYDAVDDVFYLLPGDCQGISRALSKRLGGELSPVPQQGERASRWDQLAGDYSKLYDRLMGATV